MAGTSDNNEKHVDTHTAHEADATVTDAHAAVTLPPEVEKLSTEVDSGDRGQDHTLEPENEETPAATLQKVQPQEAIPAIPTTQTPENPNGQSVTSPNQAANGQTALFNHNTTAQGAGPGETQPDKALSETRLGLGALFAAHNPTGRTDFRHSHVIDEPAGRGPAASSHPAYTPPADTDAQASLLGKTKTLIGSTSQTVAQTGNRTILMITGIIVAVILVLTGGYAIVAALTRPSQVDLKAMTMRVERHDVTATITLSAHINQPKVESIVAVNGGKLGDFKVKDGDQVTQGQEITSVSYEDKAATQKKQDALKKKMEDEWKKKLKDYQDKYGDDPNYQPPSVPATITLPPVDPVYHTDLVNSPADGFVKFSKKKGDVVQAGDIIGQITSNRQLVTARFTPDQAKQIDSLPQKVLLDVDGQERTCGNMQFSDGSAVDIQCALQYTTKPFKSAQLNMTLMGRHVSDVLTVPLTAVDRDNKVGTVYRLTDPLDVTSAKAINVRLGIDDGKNIEVFEGLNEGDVILKKNPDIVHKPAGKKGNG